MEKEKTKSAHVLLLPYPAQGHINPLLQFAHRLTANGLRVTLAVPIRCCNDVNKTDPSALTSINLEFISDGYDGGLPSDFDAETYEAELHHVGSQTLDDLIARLNAQGSRLVCLIYDSFHTWAFNSCAVSSIYCRYLRGYLVVRTGPDECFWLPGLPPLGLRDLPSFIGRIAGDHFYLNLLLGQCKNVEKADYVLKNSFDSLEGGVSKEMGEPWSPKMIGPALPSAYLSGENPRATWTRDKPTRSVVYVSFGSMAALSAEQMEEIASALRLSKWPFLWVVRPPLEHQKGGNSLPEGFAEATSKQGLVVPWCSQLDVLAHQAVGCFVTHCGWNSKLEGLSQGVPMIAAPLWSDQQTNSKFISDVWEVGVRVEVDENEVLRRGELERCIKEFMEGERGDQLRKNAHKWRDLAREAMNEGGSSDNNTKEFAAMVSNGHFNK
ncbi:hypothetical protein AMTRI_Chr06g178150 [Amborella trichopoda]